MGVVNWAWSHRTRDRNPHMSTLKIELSILEQHFPKDHVCFQVVSVSREEMLCRFVNKDERYTLHCNISVSKGTVDTLCLINTPMKSVCACIGLCYTTDSVQNENILIVVNRVQGVNSVYVCISIIVNVVLNAT